MELTSTQRRTLELLIGTGRPPHEEPGLADRIRTAIEDRLAEEDMPAADLPPIWVGKRRLQEQDRCEGLLQAGLLGEGPPFEHSAGSAAGTLFHKAIEIDVATERGFDARTVCDRAVERLGSDGAFAGFWGGIDPFDRAKVLLDAGRRLTLFRDSFPPLQRRWAAQPEFRLRYPLAGGRVVLSGAPDLVLGRTRRLVIDFKSGGAWPEHAEDMRFYALLIALRCGVAPYRVATFFLDSGEWQAEDVTGRVLERAAERTVSTVLSSWRVLRGQAPVLRPGRHCARCPRRSGCPAVTSGSGAGGAAA
jgi:hypothetical protein